MTTNYYSYLATEQVLRERRVASVQRQRARLIAVLTLFSAIELAVMCMGYYMQVPVWLMIICVVCVMFNLPLIFWLVSVWWNRRKREDEIQKQSEDRRKSFK